MVNGQRCHPFIVYAIKLLVAVAAGILVSVSLVLTTLDRPVDAFGLFIAILILASVYLFLENLGELCYVLKEADDPSSCALQACFVQTSFTIFFHFLIYLACLRGPTLALLIFFGSIKLYLHFPDSRKRNAFFVFLFCVTLHMVICFYLCNCLLDFFQFCIKMINRLTSSAPEAWLALLTCLTCCLQWLFEALVDIQHLQMHEADYQPDSILTSLIKVVFGILFLQTFLQISSFTLAIMFFFAVFEVVVQMMTEKREIVLPLIKTIASIFLVGICLYSGILELKHFLPMLKMAWEKHESSPIGFAALIIYGFIEMEMFITNKNPPLYRLIYNKLLPLYERIYKKILPLYEFSSNNIPLLCKRIYKKLLSLYECISNVCENLKILYEEMDWEEIKTINISEINWLEAKNFLFGLMEKPIRSPSMWIKSIEIQPKDSLLAIGILVDFSGSMKYAELGKHNNESEDIKDLAHSIYTTIFHLLSEDMSSKNVSFAIGFGVQENVRIERLTNHSQKVFDMIGSIENIVDDNFSMGGITDEYLEVIFSTLEQHGAKLIRKWAKKNVIKKVVPRGKGKVFKKCLVENEQFRNKFIQNILPPACRDWQRFRFFQKICVSAVTTVYKQATEEDIIRIAKDSWKLISPDFTYTLQMVSEDSIYPMTDTLTILNGDSNERFDENRSCYLLKEMKEYVFAGSPFLEGLNESFKLFSTLGEMKFHQKFLFVFTDGGDNRSTEIAKMIRDEEIKIVCCYVMNRCYDKITPRTFFCKLNTNWTLEAKTIYKIASSVPARYSYATLLKHRGWDIQGLDSLAENEFKLFCAVNDPDNIASFCDIIKDIICTEDALGEFLLEITLDRLVEKDIGTLQPWNQRKEAICFACSSAIVFTFAMKKIDPTKRIDQTELRDELKIKFLEKKDNVRKALRKLCERYPKLNLKVFKRKTLKEVMSVIGEKRLLVATMHFDDNQWNKFNAFFKREETRKLILKKELIPSSKRKQKIHHAVVLVGYTASCLIFLNSFGPDWGDGGFFRLDDTEVFQLEFFDIHWDEEKCDPRVMTNYRNTIKMMKENVYKSLKSFQTAECKCPKCQQTRPITKFRGNICEIECPSCGEHFEAKEGEGNLIALNFYLSILSRETRRPRN